MVYVTVASLEDGRGSNLGLLLRERGMLERSYRWNNGDVMR